MIQLLYWVTGYSGGFPVTDYMAYSAFYELLFETFVLWSLVAEALWRRK